jgi:hypothetical protein
MDINREVENLKRHPLFKNVSITTIIDRVIDLAYDPNQPRDPKGSPTGGQWTRVRLFQGRGIKGLPLANEDGYIYATTNKKLASGYAGIVEEHYPNRDIPVTVSTMRGEIREIKFLTTNPKVVNAKETHGNRDLERIVIEQAKKEGFDSVIFYSSAGGNTYVTWMVDKVKLIESKTDKPTTTKINY